MKKKKDKHICVYILKSHPHFIATKCGATVLGSCFTAANKTLKFPSLPFKNSFLLCMDDTHKTKKCELRIERFRLFEGYVS